MEHAEAVKMDILSPDVIMVILTWVTFFVLLFILKKFAWKPILEGLQKREDYIRQSLEDADKAKAQLAEVESAKSKILNDAKLLGSQIIDEARKTAMNLAHEVEAKARQNVQEIVKSAETQIEGERRQVREVLKKESVQIAIELAGKILKENTDIEKNRRLVEATIPQL